MKGHLATSGLGIGIVVCLAFASPSHASDCRGTSLAAPDGSALTILFDSMQVDNDSPSQICSMRATLNLPAGYGLGVYRVDYRGFAKLSKGQTAELAVSYELGPRGNGRHFARRVNGPTDGDFAFSENIGAGQMKRVGCGADASLGVTISLNLSAKPSTEAEADLDSSDSTSKHGLVFNFDLKKCQP